MTRRTDPAEAERVLLDAGLQPLEPYRSSHTPWRSVHLACGREVTPRLDKVRKGQTGCWHCGKAAAGTTRLSRERERAEADMRAAGLEPLDPYPGSQLPWRSRHVECGREVTPALTSIRRGQGGCLPCSSERHGERLRAAEEERALADMRAADLEPLAPYPGALKPWRSRHVCGREVRPRLNSIRRGQGGCSDCGYAKNGATMRAESEDEAHAVMRAAGLEPLDAYPGAVAPWRCLHAVCGREVTPRYHDVRRGHSAGCWWCSYEKRRIDPHASTIVYVLHHPGLDAVKVGVAGETVKERRVERFGRLGWYLVGSIPFTDRKLAEKVETAVLRDIRERGTPHYLTERHMRGLGGHTETFSAEEVTPSRLWELVQRFSASGETSSPLTEGALN